MGPNALISHFPHILWWLFAWVNCLPHFRLILVAEGSSEKMDGSGSGSVSEKQLFMTSLHMTRIQEVQ